MSFKQLTATLYQTFERKRIAVGGPETCRHRSTPRLVRWFPDAWFPSRFPGSRRLPSDR